MAGLYLLSAGNNGVSHDFQSLTSGLLRLTLNTMSFSCLSHRGTRSQACGLYPKSFPESGPTLALL